MRYERRTVVGRELRYWQSQRMDWAERVFLGFLLVLIIACTVGIYEVDHRPHKVTGITYTYHSLAEAREVARQYECTDIIGNGDGLYVVEILEKEACQ